MPHMAAHLVSSLRKANETVQVLDSFGISSGTVQVLDDFMLMGLPAAEVVDSISTETDIVFLYCRTIEDLLSTELIGVELRKSRPSIKIVLFENIQTVNSFSLKEIIPEFLNSFADIGVMGEPERRAPSVVKAIRSEFDGLADINGLAYLDENGNVKFTPPEEFNDNLDELEFPGWDLFDLSGYWAAGFAHPPVKRKTKFLPILTSRGCPYRCTFCVSPAINPKWRARSASNVVDEMEHFQNLLNVSDFHVSDLDPTISDTRTRSIAEEIISRRLKVTWKIAQGTKIETIKSLETLTLMKKSGCVFFSFSPETGSDRMLEIMNKKFDKRHALRLTRHMNKIGMRTQACFIAGVPGEKWKDRFQTLAYMSRLVLAGVDEIAVTIFTPIPGAKLGLSLSGYSHYSELSHSPKWREDYRDVSAFRYAMYLLFFILKLRFPTKVLRELKGILTMNFETKMEMSIYKFFRIRFLYMSRSRKELNKL